MKTIILKYGIYSSLVLVVVFGLTWLIWGTSLDYSVAETIGYLSMIIALSFIYFGIKSYRDEIGEGTVAFGEALKVGTLIALLPSAAFFIYTAILFAVKGEELVANTYQNIPEEQLAQFEANKELFLNPFFQGAVMFATVFVIGFIIALLSSWLLQRKTAKAEMA